MTSRPCSGCSGPMAADPLTADRHRHEVAASWRAAGELSRSRCMHRHGAEGLGVCRAVLVERQSIEQTLRGAETDREVWFGHAYFGNARTCLSWLSASPARPGGRLSRIDMLSRIRNAIPAGMRIRASSRIHGCGRGDRMVVADKAAQRQPIWATRANAYGSFLDRSGRWQPSFPHPQF